MSQDDGCEKLGILNCYIYKFKQHLDLSDVKETYPCVRCRLLAVLHTTCRLQFVHLDQKIKNEVPSLEGVKSFIWNKINASDSCGSDGPVPLCFTVLTEGDLLVSYRIQKEPLTATKEDSHNLKHVLTGIVKENQSLQLLYVSHQHVVLGTEGLVIGLSLTLSEVKVIYKIPCVCPYQICSDILITLSAEQLQFSFHELITGNLVLSLDVNQSVLHSKKPIFWKFSDDLERLVVLDTDRVLWVFNVKEYTSVKENTVKVELEKSDKLTSGEFASYTASKIGDEAWRDKLSFLFYKYRQGKASHQWYARDKRQVKKSITTASRFSTKKRRVSAFHKEKGEADDSYVESKMVLPALDTTSCHVTDLMFYHSVVSVRLKFKDHVLLMICNYNSGTIMQERLSPSEHLILSLEPDNPHLILTPTHLTCIIVDGSLQQEDVVSKTMMYAGASIADSLCHINQWGRCSVPINTLDIGLKHRQLDTVSFFLKSKENLFSKDESVPTSPSSSTSLVWESSGSYRDDLMQLEPALKLLIQNMADSVGSRQSVNFARKLADLTLNFLYRLLQDAVNLADSSRVQADEKELADLESVMDSLLSFISDVRRCVRQGQSLDSRTKPAESFIERKVTSRQVSREQRETQEVETDEVLEALLNNTVPELQAKRCEAGMFSMVSMDRIYQRGMERVHWYLLKKEAQPAVVILANLGVDVDKKLWEIASLTLNPEVRQFIIEECLSYTLSPQQAKDVAFLKTLEEVNRQRSNVKPEIAEEKRESAHQKELKSILQEGKSSKFPLSTENASPNVLLDWVQHWDEDSRELVLLEAGVKGVEEIDLKLYLQYLVRNNRTDILVDWIKENAAKRGDVLLRVLASRDNHCTEYTREVLIRELFRLDVYGEMADTKSFLHNLRSVRGPLVRNIPDFHAPFICFCVTENLPDVLWHYCNDHSISVEALQGSIRARDCKAGWLDMFVNFYNLALRKQKDCEAEDVYNLGMSNSAWSYKMETPSIVQLLRQGQTITAVATLMYSPTILQQLVSGNMEEQELKEIEEKLMAYPKLHGTFFSVTSREIPTNDITVYQLLKNNAAFDPSRLFGWQALNTLYGGEENMKQLPSFSQSDLVARFGYAERIRYTYYLKQGRPAFAFLSFLSEEIDSASHDVCPQRLTEACNTAGWIGVRNYHNSQVACACVAFIELLGQDSLTLRTLLQTGQEVLLHLNGNLTSAGDQRREEAKKNDHLIVTWLCASLVYKGQHATTLLHHLETAISGSLKKDKIPSSSFEAGQKWTIAVIFCQLMTIPWTTAFLETCARADKWLSFLWFAQLHQYSKQQLQPLLYKFRCPHLKQHLHYVIENAESKISLNTPPTKQGKQPPSKDVRSSLYARIGLTKEKDYTDDSSSDEEEVKEKATDSDNWLQHLTDVNVHSIPDDLFQVVFMAQATPTSWKSLLVYSILLHNPVLAVLAGCDQEAAVFPCLTGWMVAMMDAESHDQFIENHGKSVWTWGPKHFDKILNLYLDKNWMSTFATGLDIFLPDSPLLPFCKFSAALNERSDYKACKVCLEQFKEAMPGAGGSDTPADQAVYETSDWLQQKTYHIIQHHLHHMTNLHSLLHLLRLLDSQSIVLVFKFDVINFGQLARLLNTIVSAHVLDVNFKNLVSSKNGLFQEECRKVVDRLVRERLFKEARDIARESGINMESVTIEENKWEKHKLSMTSLWADQVTRRRFWTGCEERCKHHKVAPLIVAQYFQNEAEQTENLSEKAFLYQLGYQWTETIETSNTQELGDDLYNKMWRARIENAVNIIQVQHQSGSTEMSGDLFSLLELDTVVGRPLPTELLSLGKIPNVESCPNDLSEQEADALQVIISQLLDKGYTSHSCRLAAEFGVYSKDLAIVVTLIRLARGVADINSLSSSMKSIITESSSKHHRHSISTPVSVPTLSSVVSMASLGGMRTDFLPPDKEQVLVTMETLENEIRHGKKCCRRIVTCFLIACILDKSYEDIVPCHEFDVLKQILRSGSEQKFRLAADYLSTTNLKPQEIASFLCDSIVEVYKVMFANARAISREDDALSFNPSEKSEDAISFVKLCPVPATLGDKLLDAMTSLSGEDQDIPKYILDIQTELLVLAHLCHSSACNMEGISNVLRAARVMTGWMEKEGQFTNMVRLLIGIGRFNEMIYVFDSLIHNERFELLLRKGIEKEKSLKIAIIDYLKRYHPQDSETFDMVVHYFMMHREIGQLLQNRAKEILEKFKEINIESSSDQTNLQSAVQFYMDAAESYCKEGCMRHAQNCMKQARLVALQLHFVSSGVKVIHMSEEGADQFIKSHPKFSEALIVSESYNRKNCWGHALCHNVLIGGDFRYLQELKRHISLTSSLIQEVVQIFQQDPSRTVNPKIVEKFLVHCTDLKLQIQLATELDLRGFLTDLEKRDCSSYIRDITANS